MLDMLRKASEDYYIGRERRPQKTSTNGYLVRREFGYNSIKVMPIPRLINNHNHNIGGGPGGLILQIKHRAAYETHARTYRSWWTSWHWCLEATVVNAYKVHSLRCKELGMAPYFTW
jgi:hypothetical protein